MFSKEACEADRLIFTLDNSAATVVRTILLYPTTDLLAAVLHSVLQLRESYFVTCN